MSYLGNTPKSPTILRLERAKSFALALWIQDRSGRPLDISGSTIKIVMKKTVDPNITDDSDNLIVNSGANLADADIGYARFELQAADLNHSPGEYPYSIVMRDEGYSIVLASGVVEILQNPESGSIAGIYTQDAMADSLVIALDGPKVLNVFTGPSLAPGTTSFTDADKEKLDGIQPGAQSVPENRLIPPGGNQGSVLTKLSSGVDYVVGWAQPSGGGGGGGGIDPTGIPDGYVPTANGADGWDWEPADPVSISADIIVDSASKVMMTPAERTKLTNLAYPPTWAQLTGKPAFGTASLLNTNQVLQPGGVDAATDVTAGVLNNARVPKVGALLGQSVGTAAPTGGADGDWYIQYTP